jgi:hypothetical protein
MMIVKTNYAVFVALSLQENKGITIPFSVTLCEAAMRDEMEISHI